MRKLNEKCKTSVCSNYRAPILFNRGAFCSVCHNDITDKDNLTSGFSAC